MNGFLPHAGREGHILVEIEAKNSCHAEFISASHQNKILKLVQDDKLVIFLETEHFKC